MQPPRTLWGVEAVFFNNDKFGKKLLKEVFGKPEIRWGKMEHTCFWGVPEKQSESNPVPPPRAVCKCGFVAPIKEEGYGKEEGGEAKEEAFLSAYRAGLP